MRNKILLLTLIVIMTSLFVPAVMARKGVGIVWDTETEIVNENSVRCIQYGVYNPWDENVNVQLQVSEDFAGIVTKQQSETKMVKADTTHDIAEKIELCFEIGQVYSRDCLIGNMLCAQTCSEPEVEYNGKIVGVESEAESAAGTTGSATALGVSVPLKLKVKCTAQSRDLTALYIAVIVLVVLLIGWIVYSRKKK